MVMSGTNQNADINLSNVLKFNSAFAQNEIGEVVVNPGEDGGQCKRLISSTQTYSPFPPFYTVSYTYSWGTYVDCTEEGDGCTYKACDA
jgi:hypothetical protein